MDAAECRFDRLWNENAGAVLRYAYRQVPGHEVDDVVAETFAVAWRRLDDVPERALPWLLGVARGVAANSRRADRRRDALYLRMGRMPAFPAPDVGDMTDTGLDDAAATALARLSPRDRELMTLLAWEGLTPAEAAEVTGCSRATYHVRLHRARTRFRELLLASDAHGPPPAERSAASQPVTDRTGGAR